MKRANDIKAKSDGRPTDFQQLIGIMRNVVMLPLNVYGTNQLRDIIDRMQNEESNDGSGREHPDFERIWNMANRIHHAADTLQLGSNFLESLRHRGI